MGPIQAPDFCSEATRKLAEALNCRITANNAELAEARQQHDEVLSAKAQAQADDGDFLMNGDPDATWRDAEEIKAAARLLRLAQITALRSEILIRTNDMPALLASLESERVAALVAVERELADTIAKVKDGLSRLGFSALVQFCPPTPILGSFFQARPPVDVLLDGNDLLAPLVQKRKAILAFPVPNNAAEIAAAEKRLRELLSPPAPVDRDVLERDGRRASRRASDVMYAGMAVGVDWGASHTWRPAGAVGESVQADMRPPKAPTATARRVLIGEGWGGILE